MAGKIEKKLNTSGVLEMLDGLESEFDDSDADPEYNYVSQEDSTSSEEDRRRVRSPKKKTKVSSPKKRKRRPRPLPQKKTGQGPEGRQDTNPKAGQAILDVQDQAQHNTVLDNSSVVFDVRQQPASQKATVVCATVLEERQPNVATEDGPIIIEGVHQPDQDIVSEESPADPEERQLGEPDNPAGSLDGVHPAEEESNVEQGRKRFRKRKSDPATWKRNVRKESCEKGLAHTDSSGNEKTAKVPQPCNCMTCRYRCSENIPEEQRHALCTEYWQLGEYSRKKDYILRRVKVYNIQRKRLLGERKRARNKTMTYSFELQNKEIRVCKKFFLKTLAINQGSVESAVKGVGDSGTVTGEDKRGKKEPANKTKPERVEFVKNHIASFPVIESHYTRKDTHRLYLNQSLSIRKMHELYKEECEKVDPPQQPVSEKVYRAIFCNEYNLSFFVPKKDQCATCAKFKMLTGDEKEAFRREHEEHWRRKEEAQAVKSADKERAIQEEGFVSATFDLESVLQIPSSPVSDMYYSRKLCVYNMCVYNAAPPNNGFCYCWPEIEGGRGSNEIGTCFYKWLSELPPTVNEVSLFSDTCGGQNRNQNVAAMFLYAVNELPVNIITHNFLESGHSHMECDSMHAAIEGKKKYSNVYSMVDWISIFQRARCRNPYKVSHLHHQDILNFQHVAQQTMKNRRKDQDGNIVNWLLVKSFQYRKAEQDIIFYRYNYGDEFKAISIFGRGRPLPFQAPPQAYKSKIPISQAKKNDLLKLCRQLAIPEELHPWFEALPSSQRVRDQLPGPAAEDSGSDDDFRKE